MVLGGYSLGLICTNIPSTFTFSTKIFPYDIISFRDGTIHTLNNFLAFVPDKPTAKAAGKNSVCQNNYIVISPLTDYGTKVKKTPYSDYTLVEGDIFFRGTIG